MSLRPARATHSIQYNLTYHRLILSQKTKIKQQKGKKNALNFKNSRLTQSRQDFLLSSRNFKVLGLTFLSTIHFKLICVNTENDLSLYDFSVNLLDEMQPCQMYNGLPVTV